MYTISVNLHGMDFKALEQEVYRQVCQIGREYLKNILQGIDDQILKKRDREVYRNKGLKATCTKTVMGPVEYQRRVYTCLETNGERSCRYLLDEALGIASVGRMSVNLVEKIVENASVVAMRKAANQVNEMTGQDISPMGAWRVVQAVGQRIDAKEKKLVNQHQEEPLKGTREVPVLFEEADGVWLSMQRQDRPKTGHKREMKLSVTYEGWEKDPQRRGGYLLKRKRVNAGYEEAEAFKELRDAQIAAEYDTDALKTKIINGDGASWIKAGLDDENTHYQLDPFHKSRAVLRGVADKKEAGRLIQQLNSGQEEAALKRIEELIQETGGELEPVKKLLPLKEYLIANMEGLRPYQLRPGIQLPLAPEGLEYRNMGTAEHHICDVLAQRMKGRKMSWSVAGANNLSKILAEKFSGRLYDTLDSMSQTVFPEAWAREVKAEIVPAPAENKPQSHYKVYRTRNGSLPLEDSIVTEDRKAIRRLFDRKGW